MMSSMRFASFATARGTPMLAVLAAAASLAGCGTLAPDYEQPPMPVAAGYAPKLAPDGKPAVAAAGDIEWQQFFADPKLRRLIEFSLQNNRDLRVAILNIEQSRAAYQIRRADRLPTIGLGAGVSRSTIGAAGVVDVYNVGIQLSSYELDFFGRVRSLSDAALSQFLSTEEARKTTQIMLVSNVANAYIALLADEQLLRVTQDTLKTREDSHRLTKLRFENGASSQIDLHQTEQLLETARATLAATLRQQDVDQNALTFLLGGTMPSDLPEGLPLARQQAGSDLPAGLPSDLLIRRPDVRAAEEQLRAANANIGAARAAFFPRIALTTAYGTTSTQLSGLFQGGSYAFTGTANLLQPIFDAGRNRANLAIAKVNKDIAVAQYERAIQTAFREVSDSLAGRANLDEQLRAQAGVAQAAQSAYDLVDLRYRNGASSYFEVLDAQRTLFSARQTTVQVEAQQVQNRVTLYRVLGGGWTAPRS